MVYFILACAMIKRILWKHYFPTDTRHSVATFIDITFETSIRRHTVIRSSRSQARNQQPAVLRASYTLSPFYHQRISLNPIYHPFSEIHTYPLNNNKYHQNLLS